MADGRISLGLQPFEAGLNGRGRHLRRVRSPDLKCPTQFQVADGDLKVHDLKV